MVERRQWLKDLRAEKGLTVREAAEKIGLSWTYYSDIETTDAAQALQKRL